MNSALVGHYALTLYRSLTRHRLYAALNVLGLAVGIAVFLVLWLDVRFETSFERWIPDADRIDLVQTTASDLKITTSATMGGMLDQLRADYPQVLGTRIWDQPATVHRGSEVSAQQVEAADPTFFQVFDLPLAAGDKAAALAAPDRLVLTQSMARRYLAPGPPVGQTVTLTFGGATHLYRVSAVLRDLPRTSDLKVDFLVPITPQMYADDVSWRHWGSLQLATYLKFPTQAAARAFGANLARFVDSHALKDIGPEAHKHFGLRLEPLPGVHLYEPKDAAIVAALAGVGLLTLLLAATNYVNLATARAALRAREVALRKVMGGAEATLRVQFFCEAILTATLAGVIGLALCELALPMVNSAGGLALSLPYFRADGVIFVLALVILSVGLGAGAYPALLLSRFRPAAVLASAKTPGGGRSAGRVREGLVLIQFAIAIAFTVATLVIVEQSHFVRSADRGYSRDGLIVVSSFDDSSVTPAQHASLLAAWRGLAGVVSATAADTAPGNEDTINAGNFKRPGTTGDGPTIYWNLTGPDFFTTFGAHLIAGRLLDFHRPADDSKVYPDPKAQAAALNPAQAAATPAPPPPRNVVLNASAVSVFGFKSPRDAVGKTLVTETRDHTVRVSNIVGVIDDMRFRSPREPVPPSLYMMRLDDLGTEIATVRYAGADPRPVLKAMGDTWRMIAPQAPFRADTADENLAPYYRPDDQHGRLFTLGAILAVGIGCVGLYGLASFTTARRIKEIGIRKTLGASTADILRLVIGQFLRPVLLANLIAWPLAWLAMRSWLSGFNQRIPLSPLFFLAATLLTLTIALTTVVAQALAVARAEPAKALRHE